MILMSTYHFLRTVRIVLWGAFILTLPLAVSFKAWDSGLGNIVRYAPPMLFLLALLAGLIERIVRKQHNLPAKRFGHG